MSDKLTLYQRAFEQGPTYLQKPEKLEETRPWTMGIAGFFKWICRERQKVFGSNGIAKVENNKESEGRGNPIVIQKRHRFGSEDYLNKEFDTFMSLLPSEDIDDFLSTYFTIQKGGNWNYFGNSNDIELYLHLNGVMQFDGLLYNQKTNTLFGVELKIDADFVREKNKKYIEQIVKYCNLFDIVSQKYGIIGAKCGLIVIAPQAYNIQNLMDESLHLLEDQQYRNKLAKGNDAKIARVKDILQELQISSITWQTFGEYFQNKLANLDITDDKYASIYHKLISGFLYSLSKKIRKNGTKLFLSEKQYYACSDDQDCTYYQSNESKNDYNTIRKQKINKESTKGNSSGYSCIPNEKVTDFANKYFNFVKQNYPQIYISQPGLKPANSDWQYFNIKIKGLKLIHKRANGYVDLQIAGMGAAFGKLKEQLFDIIGDEIELVKANKSAALRISVPIVDRFSLFEEQVKNIDKGLIATKKLLAIANIVAQKILI